MTTNHEATVSMLPFLYIYVHFFFSALFFSHCSFIPGPVQYFVVICLDCLKNGSPSCFYFLGVRICLDPSVIFLFRCADRAHDVAVVVSRRISPRPKNSYYIFFLHCQTPGTAMFCSSVNQQLWCQEQLIKMFSRMKIKMALTTSGCRCK